MQAVILERDHPPVPAVIIESKQVSITWILDMIAIISAVRFIEHSYKKQQNNEDQRQPTSEGGVPGGD